MIKLGLWLLITFLIGEFILHAIRVISLYVDRGDLGPGIILGVIAWMILSAVAAFNFLEQK